MHFRIADTFTDSLARLTGEEQKAVKTAAFDLQLNPAQPGLQLHRIEKSKDHNFWSARVNLYLRLIVHRTESSLLLCYVNHHDEAYDKASRRKVEVHPKTGAAQLVELREKVQEILVPRYVEVERPARPKPALFAHIKVTDILGCGVPAEWVADVQKADEDTLLVLAEHLPAEAAEATPLGGIFSHWLATTLSRRVRSLLFWMRLINSSTNNLETRTANCRSMRSI